VRIDYKGTSCHTLSLSLRSCCRRWAFDQLTLVLFPGLEGLLRCSGYARVQCNAVAVDLYEAVSQSIRERDKTLTIEG
jgi:hypothetical protein